MAHALSLYKEKGKIFQRDMKIQIFARIVKKATSCKKTIMSPYILLIVFINDHY